MGKTKFFSVPARSTSIFTVPVSPTRSIKAKFNFSQVVVSFPSTAIILSPTCNWASAAGEFGIILPILVFNCCCAGKNKTQKRSTAKIKLINGPAATIAIRFHGFCLLKAYGRSCSATLPSRSSNILT
ncbi:Uncharacterised protein [Acinetobacter baumannii]|nr:Uncharacterised protein [Acinetobacter baumannii]